VYLDDVGQGEAALRATRTGYSFTGCLLLKDRRYSGRIGSGRSIILPIASGISVSARPHCNSRRRPWRLDRSYPLRRNRTGVPSSERITKPQRDPPSSTARAGPERRIVPHGHALGFHQEADLDAAPGGALEHRAPGRRRLAQVGRGYDRRIVDQLVARDRLRRGGREQGEECDYGAGACAEGCAERLGLT
jgi:hypothetical protein